MLRNHIIHEILKTHERILLPNIGFQIYLDDNKDNTKAVLILVKLRTKYIMISLRACWIKVDSFWFPVQLRSKTSHCVSSSSFLKGFGKKTGPMTLRNGTKDFMSQQGFYYFNFQPWWPTQIQHVTDWWQSLLCFYLFIHPFTWLFTGKGSGRGHNWFPGDFPFLGALRAQRYNR